jgi:KDO2-lipid IV(A) lauroyltransferase
VFWYRFHFWGVSVLPGWAVGFVIAIFCSLMFVALRHVRRAIAGNLEAVLGPCGWWRRQLRIYRTMWEFSWCLTERYERLARGEGVEFEAEGEEVWKQLVASGEGCLLVTAHLGHWEVGSFLASSIGLRRVHVVREEEGDPQAQEFIRGLISGEEGPTYSVHFARGDDPALGAKLLSALRRGELVALQGDRPRTGARAIEVPLFGRPFTLPVGPAALARASGAALVPVFVFRTGRGQARVVVRPPIRAAQTADRPRDVEGVLRALAGEVEWAIRQRPHQWFCFRELWPREHEARVGELLDSVA